MEVFLAVLSLLLYLGMLLTIYFLIKANRGNVRETARQGSAHRQQVSELLDRLAYAHDKPYNLPERKPLPPVEMTEEEKEALLERLSWKEV